MKKGIGNYNTLYVSFYSPHCFPLPSHIARNISTCATTFNYTACVIFIGLGFYCKKKGCISYLYNNRLTLKLLFFLFFLIIPSRRGHRFRSFAIKIIPRLETGRSITSIWFSFVFTIRWSINRSRLQEGLFL